MKLKTSALSAKQIMWAALTVLVALIVMMPVLKATEESELKIGDGLNPAADSDGAVFNVVVWEADTGFDTDIKCKRLDLQGDPLGTEVIANTTTIGDQKNPDVTMLSTGGFVVAWESDAGGGSEVIAQRFGGFGEPVGIELRVSSIDTVAVAPAIGADNHGNFIVAWAAKEDRRGRRPRDYKHYVRRFNSLGIPLGPEQELGRKGLPTPPTLAVKPSGAYMVAWEDHRKNIVGMAFDASGVPTSGLFQVNPSSGGQHAAPSVDVASDGDYTLAWRKKQGSASISVRRISAFAGEPVGIEFRVNETPIDRNATPQVAADGNSNVVVVWEGDPDEEEEQNAVFARLIELSGEPVGIELRVNSTAPGEARSADVTPETANSFFVVWEKDDPLPIEDPDILANCIQVMEEEP